MPGSRKAPSSGGGEFPNLLGRLNPNPSWPFWVRTLPRTPPTPAGGATFSLGVADAISAVSDATPAMAVNRATLSDVLSAVNGSVPVAQALHARAISDAISAVSEASPPVRVSRFATDALSAVSDAAPVRALIASRAVSDALSAVSDVVKPTVNRVIADSISAVSDVVARVVTFPRAASDAISAVTDAVASLRNRVISDTVSSVADSAPTRVAVHPRAAADTISAVSDALATNRNRVISDVVSSVADTAPTRVAVHPRAVSDAISAVSDTLVSLRNRVIADTISAVSDSAPARTLTRVVTDAISTVSDLVATNRNRVLTDALVTPSDVVVGARSFARTVSDAISALSDAVATNRNRVKTDAISTVSDALTTLRNRVLTDAISTPGDSVVSAKGPTRAAADTLTSFSETLVSLRNRVIADAISTVSDTVKPTISRKAADTLAAMVDTIATVRNRVLADAISTASDTLVHKAARFVTDAISTLSDTISASKSGGGVTVADTLVSLVDTIAIRSNRLIADTLATISDAVVKAGTRAVVDALVGHPSLALTVSGNEITDATRAVGTSGDGRLNDSSYGIFEASTNFVRNGGAETDLTGHSGFSGGLVTRVLGGQKFGNACFDVDATAGAGRGDRCSDTTTLPAAGETWTASVFVAPKTAGEIGKTVSVSFTTRTTGETATASVVLTAGYTRATVTLTVAGAGATGFFVDVLSVGGGVYFLADGYQAEKKQYATPYIHTDGGSATRAAARVQAPASALNPVQGWIALRMRPEWPSSAPPFSPNSVLVFTWAQPTDAANNRFGLLTGGAAWRLQRVGSGTSATILSGTVVRATGVPTTVVAAWTATTLYISVNGAPFVSTAHSAIPVGLPPTFDLGSSGNAGGVYGGTFLNGEMLWAATGLGTLSDADAAAIHAIGDGDPSYLALPGLPSTLWTADTAQTRGWTMDESTPRTGVTRVIVDTLSSFSDVTKWSYTRVASDALVTMTDHVSITTAGIFTRAVSDVLVTMVDTTIAWRRPPGPIGGTLTRAVGPVSSLVKVSGASSTLAKRAGPTSTISTAGPGSALARGAKPGSGLVRS